jgi:RHS repeat-associated protein
MLGASGSALAASQNPDGTYNETVGGNANTWTNYTNAGGNQGPTIPSFTTVEIACVVQGFRVQDGNTNWYQVASAPWSDNYFVSADAFYNNGATSGSLAGTPFVDSSVPACGSGGGTPETAGGAANTWTDYASAGGTQGPTVGGGSTVGIACKLQGFRVADGNTWWYRIAQTPWNGAYYVSADAFYNNGQTSGSLHGTPFVDPAVPDCSSGGGGGSPPGGASETAGGAANTWTNYTNAGGTQGPTIPGGSTVTIACKVTGFRVADGDTWWYQVASSPWSGGYYVSADAFYNNGATSGSLHGTPFVDSAVADCTPDSGGGNVRPGGETAGGDAQTWANYSHAGGTQGPTVPGGSTISINCRAQGFRVANGNTWWYLIASSPWDSVYYVSADAFYNNGATSGSLAGTPFYDPAVPVCVNNQEAPLYATSVASSNSTTHPTGCTYGHYPVDCASGDFWHAFTDVSVPGRGPGLDLARTYNAVSPSAGGLFGYGWSASYDQHLAMGDPGRSGDGSIVVTLEDGSQITATPSAGGGLTTPASTDSTLIHNSDGTYTLTRRVTQVETFSSTGQLVSLGDLNGYRTTLAYDAAGHLSTVTDAAGRVLTVSLGANGFVSSVTDPLGRTTSYAYDASGNLTSSTDSLNRSWSFSYDSNHRMLTMTDPRGGVVHNTYDDQGRVTAQTDPAGLTTAFAYGGDSFGSVGGSTTITDPHGNVRFEQYANGFLTKLTKGYGTPAAGTWTYAYDPDTYGVTSVTDPNGHVTAHTYDAAGNVLTTTDALGKQTTYSYNSLRQELTRTTPLGEVTTSTYDANGNRLTSTDPLGNKTTYTYADTTHPGDVTATTDPDGRVASTAYDSYGDVSSHSVSPTAGTTYTVADVYNADGEVVCEAPANATAKGIQCPAVGAPRVAATTSKVYDAGGQLASITDPNGHTTSYAYDGDGNRTRVVDPVGNVTTNTYDANNRLLSTKTAANTAAPSLTTYAYDLATGSDGCPNTSGATYCTTRRNPNGGTTAYSYDAADNRVRESLPGGQVTRYSYDSAGNKLTKADAAGVTTSYSYDAENRVSTVDYSDGTTPKATYGYDADGNRAAMTDGTGTTSYAYDADRRPTSVTNGAGAVTSYAYDGQGNITALTYPNGKTVARGYDGAGRLVSSTDWLGHTTGFQYDADGNVTATAYPNGDTVKTAYDATGAMLNTNVLSGPKSLGSVAYVRDANGLAIREYDGGNLAGTPVYAYDAKQELTTAGPVKLGYDANGNLTGNGSVQQSFNAADQLTRGTTVTGSTAYSYDPVGNRVGASPSWGRATRYSYDAAGQLTARTGQPPAVLAVTQATPASASIAGAIPVTITGTGFSEATGVKFGDRAATAVTVVSDTAITALAPAHPAGAVDIVVSGPAGSSPTSTADGFTYLGTPGITALSPAAGPTAGGTTATITGAGFTGATQVAVGAVGATFKVVSDSQISVTLPPGSGTVALSVRTPAGRSATAAAAHFTYANGPVVTSVAPSIGPAAGGTTVTVNGAGFTGTTAVSFGATPATGVTVASDSQLTATAPAGSATADIMVTAPAGTSGINAADRYTYAPVPKVGSILSPSGSSAGGTTVAVTGTGFVSGATTVAFGSTSARGVHVLSSTALEALAPPGTGTVDITVATPGGRGNPNGADRYTYLPPTTAYGYNGDGLRMAATNSATTVNFAWDSTPSVPQIISDANASYIYGPGGTPLEQIDGTGNPSYFFHDAIGSTRLLTNADGTVGATFTYTAYGSLSLVIGRTQTPVLFAGAYLDRDSGLYYMIHRTYDQATGQFVTVDPAVDQTGSSYGYAGNDPANSTDRLGLASFSLCVGICVAYDSNRNGWGAGFGLGGSVQVGVVSLGTVGTSTITFPHTGQLSWSAGTGFLGGEIDAQPGRVTGVQVCAGGRWHLAVCAGGNPSDGGGGAYSDPFQHPSPLPIFRNSQFPSYQFTPTSAHTGPRCGPSWIWA